LTDVKTIKRKFDHQFTVCIQWLTPSMCERQFHI